ncbi:hypothetical protein D918_01727 [Trichuris suis]|nr:hypothetical protein D918_01727 [Trichuris suis]
MDRATKSGIAAEAEAKATLSKQRCVVARSFFNGAQFQIKSKFSPDQASQLLTWIRDISEQEIDTDGSMENFIAVLKDGVVLCKLANALQPGAIRKINETKMAFKQMENINNFLNFAESVVGVPKSESFMTVDLYESQDPNSVLICLASVARKAHKFGKPSVGPKEAQGEKREWTDEQMRAGSNIISLQYGSNKGATQSGMNIGNSRHIILNQ